jgi:hypothetical protein
VEKIWRLPLNRVYRGMGTWHCRRFPGTNSSKHEFSSRRTLQGTYFLRSNSPAYDPSSGHTLNQSIFHLPQTHQNLQTKPNLRKSSLQKTRDVQESASPTSSQHQTKRSSHPFHNPYSPSHQKHQMKVKSAYMTHSSSVEIARRATKYLQEIEMKKIDRVNDSCKAL